MTRHRTPVSVRLNAASWEARIPTISAAVRAFSLTSHITQRDAGYGRPGGRILWRSVDRDSTGRLHRGVPGVRPCDGSGPLDDPAPTSPVGRELASRPGLTGMQISDNGGIQASWMRFRR